MGETIYKGAPSYDLMLQLQLGIRWSVGRITPERRVTLPQCCPPPAPPACWVPGPELCCACLKLASLAARAVIAT